MKYLASLYPWFLIAPIVLPLVVWGEIIYPYLVPKTVLFYALSLLTLAAATILIAHGKRFYFARLRRRETWVPGLLLVLAYAASIAGIDFYRSFWSVFVRGDGLLMLTGVVASFYLILLSADHKFCSHLMRGVAVVGTLVAIYGIGEWVLAGGRIGSLLGNAAFFAGYLGIAFFATLIAAHSAPLLWRRAAYVGAALQILAIVLTATRGTLVALIFAGFITLMHGAFRGVGTYKTTARISVGICVLIAILFIVFRSSLAQSPFSPLARLAQISTQDTDVASRLFIWRNMVTEIEKAPWLGVGVEHIDVLFNRFYDPTQIQEQWFDRSHNAFLDYVTQYGLGGLLLYIALIGMFFVSARRLVRRGETTYGILFALLAFTYAVQNFFVFDTVSSFWLLLALLACSIVLSSEEDPLSSILLPRWIQAPVWIFAIILLILIIPLSLQPFLAAYDLAQAYHYQITDPAREIKYLSEGMALQTYGSLEYGYEVYEMYVDTQRTALSGSALEAVYQTTLSILTTTFTRFPYDARTALYLSHVLSLPPPGISVDKNLLSAALERAVRLSPKRAQPWYILANLSITEANKYPAGSNERAQGYASARDLLTQYLALVPALAEPHFVLAQLAFAMGDSKTASLEAAHGKAVYQSDLETARRAAGYYEKVQDWANAAFFLNDIVRMRPTEYVSQYDLAKVTYLSGKPAEALTIVQSLRQSDPAILVTDQNFLNAITTYEHSHASQ